MLYELQVKKEMYLPKSRRCIQPFLGTTLFTGFVSPFTSLAWPSKSITLTDVIDNKLGK